MCPKKSHPKVCPSSQTQPQPPPPLAPPPIPPQEILLPSPPQHMDILTHQQELFLKRQGRPYQIPLPRSQSVDRLLELHHFPHLAPLTSHLMNCFLPFLPHPKEKVTLLLEKKTKQVGKREKKNCQ